MYCKAEYGIYKRKLSTGKSVYYYYVYDSNGKRVSHSTGQRSKAKALEYVLARREEGLLGVIDKKSLTLNEFTEDMFVPGKCPIEREAKARGKTLAGSTMQNRRISLNKHILPYLGKTRVSALTSAQINDWLVSLPEKDNLSRTSCNQCLDALSTVMKYAIKKGIIRNNPCSDVENLGDDSTAYPAFTVQEVDAIIGWESEWKNPLIRLMCIVASVTGMRLGEILALQPCNVHEKYLDVKYNMSPTDGLKSTKSKKPRMVPINHALYRTLKAWFPKNPEGYIFSMKGDVPYTPSTVSASLKARCEKLGIKGKTFHSFRAYFDSIMMARNINETTLRKVIGHKDAKMTEHYLHLDATEFDIITDAQNEIGGKYFIDKSE